MVSLEVLEGKRVKFLFLYLDCKLTHDLLWSSAVKIWKERNREELRKEGKEKQRKVSQRYLTESLSPSKEQANACSYWWALLRSPRLGAKTSSVSLRARHTGTH